MFESDKRKNRPVDSKESAGFFLFVQLNGATMFDRVRG